MSTLRLITGMSRGGTTSMTRALNQIPGVVAFGETLFWGRFYEPPDPEGFYHESHLKRLAGRYHRFSIGPHGGVGGLCFSRDHGGQVVADTIASATPPITPGDLFGRIGSAVVVAAGQDPETTAWVEKTPHHLMHVDRIIEANPSARFTVMLRDPQNFLLSYKYIGDVKPAQTQKQFHGLYHPMTAAVVCRGYLKAAHNAVSKYPEHVQICRFEEITTDFPRAMSEVCRHLGLPAPREDTFPADNTSFDSPRAAARPELNGADKAWLEFLCRKPATAVGYSIPRQRMTSSVMYAAVSSGRLVPWFFRNRQLVAGSSSGGIWAVLKRWIG